MCSHLTMELTALALLYFSVQSSMSSLDTRRLDRSMYPLSLGGRRRRMRKRKKGSRRRRREGEGEDEGREEDKFEEKE